MYATEFAQVGANIQRKLIENNMSQQDLADALGISKQVMSKIIRGNKAINVNELSKIANILDTSANSLLVSYNEPIVNDTLSFMGEISDNKTLERINLIREAIDEIHMLEDLLDAK